MPSMELAHDDVVETHEEGAANDRVPLLVLSSLRTFLDGAGIGTGEQEIGVTPVGDGHSNHTFILDRGADSVILRRPPRGPLPPSAHDMLREARVLRAVQTTPVKAPAVLATCADEAVIGAPFYVMEKMDGHVITDTVPDVLDTPEQRRALSFELVDALVELHAVDWRAAGLGEGFGKPDGYLERQVKRFLGLWEHNRTREIPEVERVGAWLREHMPAQTDSTIVHGDFRLGNVMYAPEAPARLVAIFDWEMSTIGDPLADLGYLQMMWSEATDPDGGMFELNRVTRAEGFPTRAEMVARYEERSGRSMTDITWYTTLALWKAIVFMEGNYKRATSGASDDPFLKTFGDGVIELARRAEEVSRGGA
ncbi:phosphotransferase family protein [Conexibacter sp. W3-3-2]|uniref:phosphotransferase family protein n=1 Tax=Conexibacter sp. W3-3-2 TaxID=2675227 RepID=UPI001E564F15|nr:phosphotransferase family protein [Conexibacter sp. W3-3-2]